MRIAIFTDVFPPSINGVSSSVFLLGKELVKRGHFVKIFTPKIKKGQLGRKQLEGIHISYVPSIPSLIYPDIKLGIPVYPKTIYRLVKDKIDVVHFHTPLPVCADGILAAKLLGKPIVGTFHTYFMEPEYLKIIGIKIPQQKIMNAIVKLGWKYANLFYNAANIITTPSDTTKKALKKHKIKRPIKTITNGINIPHTNTPENSDHTKNKNLLYVGRLSKEKNLDLLIQSFKIIHAKKPAYRLMIIGDGPAKKSLQKLVQKENVQRNVIFKGSLPFEKLMNSNIYKKAAIFVTASTSETQGLSIIESMARGLPVVGIAKRGVTELIKNNGYLCKTTDPQEFAANVLDILDNPKKAKKMSIRSTKLAKKYAIEYVAKQFEKVYSKAINQKRKTKLFSWL